MKKRLGTLALMAASVLGLAAPTTAMARDWRNDSQYYSDRDHREYRREYKDRLRAEKEERRRLERERRFENRYRNNTPYGYQNSPNRNNGYYDRFGVWHRY